jgi:HlyD family secretion protein
MVVATVLMQSSAPAQTVTEASVQPPPGVSGLGRIQAEDAPVRIGGRSLSGQPSLVSRLHVREADYVKAGQTLATLDSLRQLEAAVRHAEQRIKVADVRLRQVMAGAKSADVAAQQAAISRLEVELQNARRIFARTENLFKQGIAPQSDFDRDRLPVDSLPQQIAEAKERLRSLSEVRQIDVDVAAAELQAAESELERAKAEAEAAVIRAPYNGLIIKIHAWEGSEVGPNGILELARVDKMYVFAEVAESDIHRVKVGQRAKITGYSLPNPMEGAVERMGMRVSRNSLAIDNPVNITDARVMEVRILLDDGSAVRNLIDAQVDVVINP